jgi:hypothetical protein
MSDKKREATKIKRLLDDYDKMIDLAKTDFGKQDNKKLKRQIESYSHFLIPDVSDTPFQDFAKSHYRYSNLLNIENGEKQTRTFFKAIQADLRKKLLSLQNFFETDSSGELLSFTGEVKLIVDRGNNMVVQIYAPGELKYSDELDLEMEYKLLNYKFFEIVSYLIQELPLERLLLCPNPKCGLPYFQANQRKKYCSVQCSKAASHVAYMIRENEKEKIAKQKNSKIV